jgi:2,4-dichlorophenol 6-monooxygenase
VLRGHATGQLLASYEPEREPVAVRNVQRSVENALNHVVTTQILGVTPDVGAEANWRQVRRIWSRLPGDATHRQAVKTAIAGQSMEFNEHNIEYGYTYNSAAIIPDGTPEPESPDPIRIYQPAARPGHPLPHAWIETSDGIRLSTLDLIQPSRFLLIAGEDGDDWCSAAQKLAADTGLPLDGLRIGHADGDYLDPRSTWTRHRGHSPGGAVLVRPDRFIAWRSPDLTGDPASDLQAALLSILGRGSPTT